jgi:hypothetical protein
MTGDIATRRINNSKAWTSDEDERLRQLVISNASLSDIAEDLGRTASAVRARAHACGLEAAFEQREISR